MPSYDNLLIWLVKDHFDTTLFSYSYNCDDSILNGVIGAGLV